MNAFQPPRKAPGNPQQNTEQQKGRAAPEIHSPRQIRLLRSLQDGSKSRETLDRLVGASNTPDVVFRLRNKGFSIPCEWVPATDRDGRPCHYGRYSLTESDKKLAREALRTKDEEE